MMEIVIQVHCANCDERMIGFMAGISKDGKPVAKVEPCKHCASKAQSIIDAFRIVAKSVSEDED